MRLSFIPTASTEQADEGGHLLYHVPLFLWLVALEGAKIQTGRQLLVWPGSKALLKEGQPDQSYANSWDPNLGHRIGGGLQKEQTREDVWRGMSRIEAKIKAGL